MLCPADPLGSDCHLQRLAVSPDLGLAFLGGFEAKSCHPFAGKAGNFFGGQFAIAGGFAGGALGGGGLALGGGGLATLHKGGLARLAFNLNGGAGLADGADGVRHADPQIQRRIDKVQTTQASEDVPNNGEAE